MQSMIVYVRNARAYEAAVPGSDKMLKAYIYIYTYKVVF